jgi:threonine dehydrogenase-like Zn-dependent dehydrogenase
MRVLELTKSFTCQVIDVPAPTATTGHVIIDVQRVGLCGTDVEFFRGEMPYLHDGNARYPMRLGHEWMGTVTELGEGVDPKWLGQRVTGDTMLGCGTCRRCLSGHQHVCENRVEVGVRGDFPGALGEQLRVPASSLHTLPNDVDDAMGALVEPGGNALRAVLGAGVTSGERLLILGPGTIGLLAGLFALSQGVEVHLAGVTAPSIAFARTFGFSGVWHLDELPTLEWDAVINATSDTSLPARALDLVEPGGRVVYIGIGTGESVVDSRWLTLKDVTAVGILSASPALDATIELFSSGRVDPRALIAATVGLDDVASVLDGERPASSGPGPKIQVDPRR